MACKLEILDMIAGAEPASLVPAVGAGIAASGTWELFVEVRMSAGPTVRIWPAGQGGYAVAVTWGSQHATLTARALDTEVECADRLAYAFYQMRDAQLVQD